MRHIVMYYLRMLIAYLPAYVHSSLERMHPRMHPYMHAYMHTHKHAQQRHFSDFICCPDESPACIFHQMLAPSHSAQVLF